MAVGTHAATGLWDSGAAVSFLVTGDPGRLDFRVKDDAPAHTSAWVYAPASDRHDPGGYAQLVAKRLGVSAATPFDKLLDA